MGTDTSFPFERYSCRRPERVSSISFPVSLRLVFSQSSLGPVEIRRRDRALTVRFGPFRSLAEPGRLLRLASPTYRILRVTTHRVHLFSNHPLFVFLLFLRDFLRSHSSRFSLVCELTTTCLRLGHNVLAA